MSTHQPDQLAEPSAMSPAKAAALIVLFGLLAYANSINGAFVFDDLHWIVQNPLIDEPIAYLKSWGTRWLIAATLLLNYRLGGLDPVGYHVLNLAVHLAAALTVFGLVRRTLLLPRWAGRFEAQATGLGFACALLWMLHPLQTQSVTYIVQRCESLMGFFYLLTMYCALRSFTAEAGKWKWYLGAVAACGLGMLSKEVMVTAPLMVVVFDWVFLALPWHEQLRRRWALYAGLAATYVLLIPAVLGALPASDAEVSVGFGVKRVRPLSYAMTQPGAILYYVRLTFWPDALCLDYWDWPTAEACGDWLPQTAAVFLLLAGTVVGLWRRSWLGFLGAWFSGILALTSSFIPIDDKVFEHRMYLPLLAPVVAAVAAVGFTLSRLLGARLRRAAVVALGLAVVVLLTAGTIRRNADYASAERMWRDVIAKRPGNPRAYVSLGAALLDQGRLDEAAEAFRTTLQLRPGEPTSHNNLGIILMKQGRPDEAIRHFRAAIASRPSYASAHHQLGLTLLRRDQLDAAAQALKRAVELEPGRGAYRYVLAFTLAEAGETDAAEQERRQATLLDRSWPQRMVQRASVMLSAERVTKGELAEAMLLARQAAYAQQTPDAETLYVLARAWLANGSADQARRIAELATRRARAEDDLEFADHVARRFGLPGN